MPELPEVETVKLSLEPFIIGQQIKGLTLKRANIRYPIPLELSLHSKNAIVINLSRRAKYLLLNLDNGYTIIIHLGMSGKFQLKPLNYELIKHDHVIFHCTRHNLVFHDPRRFGLIDIVPTLDLANCKYFINLGPEPLTDQFSADYLQQALAKRSQPIKLAIMDNKIVVGVGNIYASESLYLANINPLRSSYSLSENELERLVISIKQILNIAIAAGGSSLRDYVSATGKTGYFQHHFNIYGKKGQTCNICNSSVIMIKLGGRASFYCPKCQL